MDPTLKVVSDYVVNGWSAKSTKELQPYDTRKQDITMEDSCLLWGVRVPKSLETRLLSSKTMLEVDSSQLFLVERP